MTWVPTAGRRKPNADDMSQLRARVAARGLGVRHTDLQENERALALRYISLGASIKLAARAHKVLPQTIRNWQARAAAGASLADAPRSGRPSKIAQPETQKILKIIHEPATGSLRKATAQLAATGVPAVASSTIQRNLTRSSGYLAAHPSSHRRIGKPEWRGQSRMPIPAFAASCSPTASTSGAGHCASAQVHGSKSQILGPRLLSPSTALPCMCTWA